MEHISSDVIPTKYTAVTLTLTVHVLMWRRENSINVHINGSNYYQPAELCYKVYSAPVKNGQDYARNDREDGITLSKNGEDVTLANRLEISHGQVY
jgi:hypothetical protein